MIKKIIILFYLSAPIICLAITSVSAAEKRILIDSIHAHNFLNEGLTPDNYNYHEVHGLSSAFKYLKSQNIEIDEIKEGILTENLLSSYNMLFINLVSEDLDAFLVEEILAIKRFVKNGGSLFIISDHSNCYHHINKLKPLLIELGIKSHKETACDLWPYTVGEGNGWINISHFKKHPITASLKNVVFQTGGTVDSRYAIATTSKEGWGDMWTNYLYGQGDSSRGFYGNWIKDPKERSGKLGVILAKEFNKGRIVIVADQNIFGNEWIKYADNYKLFLNITSWLLCDKQINNYEKFIEYKAPAIMLFEDYKNASFGITYGNSYYNIFSNINRYFWTFTRNNIDYNYDLIILANQNYNVEKSQIKALQNHLKKGNKIIMLSEEEQADEIDSLLLETLLLNQPVIKTVLPDNSIEYNLKEAGKILVILNAGIFNNNHINKPTQQPSLSEKQRIYQLKDLIKKYLPRNKNQSAPELEILKVKGEGFLNYHISNGNITDDNLILDNSFNFFHPENYLRYKSFYDLQNLKPEKKQEFPLILDSSYPLTLIRKVSLPKNYKDRLSLELELTLSSSENIKIKTYRFKKNISYYRDQYFQTSIKLPKSFGKYKINYLWKIVSKNNANKKTIWAHKEQQDLYLLFKKPIKESRLYLSLVDKSIGWLNRKTLKSKEKTLDAIFNGIWNLGKKGYYYKYGGYELPENSKAYDKLDVFIDHKEINCGELRCLMLNLAGYYGIRGKEYLIIGKKKNWYDGSYVVYKTYPIQAFGPKNNTREWIHWNHGATIFDNTIYDPTFNIKTDRLAYLKLLFAAYGKPIKKIPCNKETPWCYKHTDLVEFINKDALNIPLNIEINDNPEIYR